MNDRDELGVGPRSEPSTTHRSDQTSAGDSDAEQHRTLKLLNAGGPQLGPDGVLSLADAAVIHDNPGALASVAGGSHQGQVREDNQDHFLVASLERTLLVEHSSLPAQAGTRLTDIPQGRLMIIADGVGGHEGGKVASAVAVDAMAHYAFETMPWVFSREGDSGDELGAGLRAAMEKAQERIRRVARRKQLSPNLGTTLTMAYVAWPEAFLVHVGDSRAYLLRDRRLYRLTRDHTLAQQLVDENALSADQAKRSRLAHVLVNAMGGHSDELEVELHRLELQVGDQLLLCSDGLYDMVADDSIMTYLFADDAPVQTVVEGLIGAANEAGGRDNVTVILARF